MCARISFHFGSFSLAFSSHEDPPLMCLVFLKDPDSKLEHKYLVYEDSIQCTLCLPLMFVSDVI